MENVFYKTSDNSLEYKLQFITVRNIRFTHLGKSWPKHTQCLMYCNGLLECFETIIKHAKDEDNQNFAYKLVGEKCLKHINNKWLRSQVRIQLNEAISKNKNQP